MTSRRKQPYRVCVNCGAALDSGEHCDCERMEAENRATRQKAAVSSRKQVIQHNIAMMEKAYVEFDYS